MYQNVRRERYYAMQQSLYRPGYPTGGPPPGSSRSQSVIITAITLFALSGLLVGFAFGALTIKHPQAQVDTTTKKTSSNPIVLPQASTPTPIPQTKITALGYPFINNLSAVTQIADGTTSYSLSAYPVDQSIDKGHGAQVHSTGITCKIWLTKHTNVTETLLKHTDILNNVNSLTQPMPDEEQNALTFSGTTQQTQPCNATGNTTWTYTIAPTVDNGTYLLVILTDWSGQHWNWFTTQIQITNKQG
jgi:hypothetical protein